MTAADNLGPLTRTYQTNDRRRRERALILLVAGVVSTPTAVGWTVAEQNRSEQAGGVVAGPGLVVGIAVILLLMGAALSVAVLYTRGEKFHLYEHGLVRETRNKLEIVRWCNIDGVDPIWDNGMVRWALGGDSGCKLRLNTGHEMYVTGFTEDAAELRRNVADRIRN